MISKDLKKRGMSFVGSTIIYSFMQAVGMVNDHHDGLLPARQSRQGARMIRTVIWDWNGTLFDDVDVCIRSMNQLLGKYGLPAITAANEYRSKFRFPVSEYYRLLGFDFSVIPFPVLAAEFIAIYQSASKECELSPEAETALADLAKRSVGQIILSASEQKNLVGQVNAFPIGSYFDSILGISDIYARTKEDLAHVWLAGSGSTAKEVLMIGDTFMITKSHENSTAIAYYTATASAYSGNDGTCTVISSLRELVPALDSVFRFCTRTRAVRRHAPTGRYSVGIESRRLSGGPRYRQNLRRCIPSIVDGRLEQRHGFGPVNVIRYSTVPLRCFHPRERATLMCGGVDAV
jgi:phosphoglycolate phosphatase